MFCLCCPIMVSASFCKSFITFFVDGVNVYSADAAACNAVTDIIAKKVDDVCVFAVYADLSGFRIQERCFNSRYAVFIGAAVSCR